MRFEALRKAVKEAEEKFFNEWRISVIEDADGNKIDRWLTPYMSRRYKNGYVDIEQARKSALASIVREYDKSITKKMAKIEVIEKAQEFESCTITVEWKKNSTWRANPTATVKTNLYTSASGTASGCGYDKESTSIANALNSLPEVLKPLYVKAENLGARKEEYREKIGYGSGYSILPYFEGGVGVSCYYQIFESMGYTMRHTASGKTFDVYTVVKKAGE